MTEGNKKSTDIIHREKRRQELGETQFTTNQQGGALMQPRNGKELMDMANLMSASGHMIRDIYRGNPGDCAALIMVCQPYGFNPFMVSWKTYKASKSADAPISFEGQLVNAMVNQSAPIRGRLKYSYGGEGQTRRCTVVGIDKETGEDITYTTPELKSIPTKNSPLWKGDPDQQLGYYAARSWARRHFPELLLGVYTREEIDEAPRRTRDVTPTDGGAWAAKAMSAREPHGDPDTKPQEDQPIDGEILPYGEGEGDGGQPEAEEARKWSFECDEGVTAFKAGKGASECPYQAEPEQGDWMRGWSEGHEAANPQEGGEA